MKQRLALALALSAGAAWAAPGGDPASVVARTGQVHDQTIAIPPLARERAYSLSFSVAPAGAFGARSRVEVSLVQGSATLIHKTLHLGDSGLFAVFHAASTGPAGLTVSVSSPLSAVARYRLQVNRWPEAPGGIHRGPSRREQPPAYVAGSAPAGGSICCPSLSPAAVTGRESSGGRRRKAQAGGGVI